MNGFAVLLIVIACLIITLMAIPVSFRGRVHLEGTLAGYAEVAALGGMVKVHISKAYGGVTKTRVTLGWWDKAIKAQRPQSAPKKSKVRNNQFKFFLDIELWRVVVNYLKKLLACLNLRVRLEGEYGTGDPAATGLLSGLIAAFSGRWPGVVLNPNFMEAILDIEGEFQGRFFPIIVLWHTAVVMLSFPIRRLWWPKSRIDKNKVQEVVSYV